MSGPLQDYDPRQLGAFRLRERVSESPEGVVYLARDADGRPVSVAVLSEGAAADPAARDRFAAAVSKGAGVPGAPRVLASSAPGASVAWVATSADGDHGRAAAFLRPVGVAGARAAGTPRYAPYWSGAGSPGAARWGWLPRGRGAAAAESHPNRGVIAGLLMLIMLFLVLLVLLYLWLAGVREQANSQPAPDPESSGSPSPSPQPSPSPRPSETGESGSPDPDSSGEPSPGPSDVPSVPLDERDFTGVPVDPSDPASLA
ncbi:hypothetical protein [Marinactinospora rubrisoli]|uniref:Serine/threonine protein kinase n=1 Tax=Marinactinospora rubrisoli TaxID=2715399 RepID=A0ABW2KCI6_9ACTN